MSRGLNNRIRRLEHTLEAIPCICPNGADPAVRAVAASRASSGCLTKLKITLSKLKGRKIKAYCAGLCIRAVDSLFDISGGHALFISEPIQRFHRDAQAMLHRENLTLDFVGQTYGRLALAAE